MIYLDNSATTRVSAGAAAAARHYMTEEFFNPSAMYAPAVQVEREVERVRAELAASLGAKPSELYFTSGGTESDNIAILGTASVQRDPHARYITTEMEHPAVYNVFLALARTGADVVFLKPDSAGRIDPAALAEAVNERTALVSVMHVNNEFGSVQDLAALSSAIAAKNPETYFHSDGVQGFGKLPFGPLPVDLYSISGHKFHAPKGIGALLMKKRVKNAGGQLGGGQERGVRSGTTNASGIAAMGAAFEELRAAEAENLRHMRELKLLLANYLLSLPDVLLNGPKAEEGAPHILNCSFLGVRGEVLLHALEERGIYVSTGSACSSHKKGKNRVLASIGVEGERAEGAIRFSLSAENTPEEMARTAGEISNLLGVLRRFRRR